MIFNKTKAIDIGYIIDIKRVTEEEIPIALFKNIEVLPSEKRTGCPAAASADKRMYQAYPPFTIDIEFGVNGIGEPFYKYNLEESEVFFSKDLEKLIQSIIRVTNNRDKFVDLQLMLPYSFITDDKDLEVLTTPPIGMQTENVFYLAGAYKPYGWIRNQNSAWILQDLNKVGKVKFDVNKYGGYWHFIFWDVGKKWRQYRFDADIKFKRAFMKQVDNGFEYLDYSLYKDGQGASDTYIFKVK